MSTQSVTGTRPTSSARVRVHSASSDIEQARALLEDLYDGAGWTATPTDMPFAYRRTGVGTADILLASARFTGALSGLLRTEQDYVVSWMKRGRGAVRIDRALMPIERGAPILHAADRVAPFEYEDFETNVVHLNKSLVERVFAESTGSDRAVLSFDAAARPTGPALRGWWQAVDAAARTLLPDAPDAPATALLDAEMARGMATAFLAAFPHEAPGPQAADTPGTARTRQAVDFVHAHAHLPITSTDMAEAAHLSLRGLQEAFRRDLDTTPSAYLRSVRLERVRQELLVGDPASTSVADVARRWAFGHLGRFAASYTNRFGELPSVTLRR